MIGERDNVSGRDLLVALAAGFKVTTRVGVGSDYRLCASAAITVPAFYDCSARPRQWSRLRGLSPEATARAFGLAGQFKAGGTFAASGIRQ